MLLLRRQCDAGAVYGGEMSAHHYFRDFNYCDSGMIPWLLTWELLSQTSHRLNELIKEQKSSFPSSGEINSEVLILKAVFSRLENFILQWFTIDL